MNQKGLTINTGKETWWKNCQAVTERKTIKMVDSGRNSILYYISVFQPKCLFMSNSFCGSRTACQEFVVSTEIWFYLFLWTFLFCLYITKKIIYIINPPWQGLCISFLCLSAAKTCLCLQNKYTPSIYLNLKKEEDI